MLRKERRSEEMRNQQARAFLGVGSEALKQTAQSERTAGTFLAGVLLLPWYLRFVFQLTPKLGSI